MCCLIAKKVHADQSLLKLKTMFCLVKANKKMLTARQHFHPRSTPNMVLIELELKKKFMPINHYSNLDYLVEIPTNFTVSKNYFCFKGIDK